MADISKITVNGITYDIKDSVARQGGGADNVFTVNITAGSTYTADKTNAEIYQAFISGKECRANVSNVIQAEFSTITSTYATIELLAYANNKIQLQELIINNNVISVSAYATYKDADIDSLLSLKENSSNKVTSIAVSSSDVQYPSAKCVYDNISDAKVYYGLIQPENNSIWVDTTPNPVSWADGTPEEIASMVYADRIGALNLRDYWSVGDTRIVNLASMSATGVSESHASQNVELVLMDNICDGFTWTETPSSNVTKPRFIVGMKQCFNEMGNINPTESNVGGWRDCARRTWCNNIFREAVPQNLRGIFKEFTWSQGTGGGVSSGLYTTNDYFALPPLKAIVGSAGNGQADEGALYNNWVWYQTASNRIKTVNGNAYYWRTGTPEKNVSNYFQGIYIGGSYGSLSSVSNYGISVFGCV